MKTSILQNLMRVIIISFIFLAVILAVYGDDDGVVSVIEGQLKGEKRTTDNNKPYYAFLGVPYARPPKNNFRFKLPATVIPWDGIRDATKAANVCIQVPPLGSSVIGDEDCLYLNILTPTLTPTKPLPVMFYIHGGAFVGGGSTEREGEYLVEKDVVFVSVEYRLGMLGFLNLGIPEVQGNMGLKDMVKALGWMQHNIAAFGGDPNNVVLLGYSSGAAAVEYLMISQPAWGLFHKAIAHSGSILNPWANNFDNAATLKVITNYLGKTFQDNKQLYKYLSTLPAADLVKAAPYLRANRPYAYGGLYYGFVPTIETLFSGQTSLFTKSPFSLWRAGRFAKVPMISGNTRREGLVDSVTQSKLVAAVLADKKYALYLPFNVTDAKRSDLDTQFKKVYADDVDPSDEKDAPAVNFFTDLDFLAGSYITSGIKSIFKNDTYNYEFAFDGDFTLKKRYNIPFPGAIHGNDINYLLNLPDVPKEGSDADKLMRKRLLEMWANFAYNGKPTLAPTETVPITWEPRTRTKNNYLVIDKDLALKENIVPERMKLYADLYRNNWNY